MVWRLVSAGEFGDLLMAGAPGYVLAGEAAISATPDEVYPCNDNRSLCCPRLNIVHAWFVATASLFWEQAYVEERCPNVCLGLWVPHLKRAPG